MGLGRRSSQPVRFVARSGTSFVPSSALDREARGWFKARRFRSSNLQADAEACVRDATCKVARLPRLLMLLLLLLKRQPVGGVEAQCWLEDCTPNPTAAYGCGAPPSRCRPEPKQCDTEPASRADAEVHARHEVLDRRERRQMWVVVVER